MENFYIIGTGSSSLTRTRRRGEPANPPVLVCGSDISLRRGRRITVSAEILVKHIDAIYRAAASGTVQVVSSSYQPVPAGQLYAVVGLELPEAAPAEELPIEPPADPGPTGEDDDEAPPEETETSEEKGYEETKLAEELAEAETQEADEKPAEASEELEVEEEAEEEVETEEEEEVEETEDGRVEGAPSERAALLPADWRGFTNAQLEVLIEEHGMTPPERRNKANLISAVEDWLKAD